MPDDQSFQLQLARIEELILSLEQVSDPEVQTSVRELVQLILDLHGNGLVTMLDMISQSPSSGQHLIDTLAENELVSHVLLLHGLHPEPAETRIQRALERINESSLQPHNVQAELVAMSDEGTAQLQLSGQVRPGSSPQVREAIEQAVFEQAPDVIAIHIIGLPDEDSLRKPLPLVL